MFRKKPKHSKPPPQENPAAEEAPETQSFRLALSSVRDRVAETKSNKSLAQNLRERYSSLALPAPSEDPTS